MGELREKIARVLYPNTRPCFEECPYDYNTCESEGFDKPCKFELEKADQILSLLTVKLPPNPHRYPQYTEKEAVRNYQLKVKERNPDIEFEGD